MQVHVLAYATALRCAEDRVRFPYPPDSVDSCIHGVALIDALFLAKAVVMPGEARRYRHTSYHKQTKNQWARDDPAFVIICSLLVAAAATAYCVT